MNLEARRLTIFTEGDVKRGLGHLMRCTGYAEAWRQRGGEVHWVVDGDPAAKRVLQESGVQWSNWQTGQMNLSSLGVALVDSYSANPAVLASIASKASRTVIIDDLFRVEYPAGSLVVHSSPGPFDGEQDGATWLMGPSWHPIRRAFWDVPERDKPRERPTRALILAGGVDNRQMSTRLAKSVRRVLPSVAIEVVAGAGASTPPDLPENVTVRHALSAEQMRDSMLTADVAVTAAGQTIFELARCGCPAVLVGTADNQANHMKHWPDTGAGLVAGWWYETMLEQTVETTLRALTAERRGEMARVGPALVDGRGTDRLIELIWSGGAPADEPRRG